jgi:hypothetical protein
MALSQKSKHRRPESTQVTEHPCSIIFGHNVSVRQVCLLLNVPATQLIFSPEEAEDVADKLRYYAKAARGEKPS